MTSQLPVAPPKLPLKFLKWFCHPDLIEDVEGDLSELFAARIKDGEAKAKLLFTLDVMLLLRPGIIKNFESTKGLINYAMFKNYLKIARRNALKYKGFTALNLLGLVIGIASSILILLWVNDEVGVDKFHANGDKIYQLFRNMRQSNGIVGTTPAIPKPAADLMVAEYPEVDNVALLSYSMDAIIGEGEDATEEMGRVANQEFLDMFSFTMLAGDEKLALTDPTSLIISRTLAEKRFGSNWKEKALGSSLRIDNSYDLNITGVFEDPGTNSSIDFDWIGTTDAFISQNAWVNNWGNGSFRVYFMVDNEKDLNAVSDRILNEINDHTADNDLAGDETLIVHKFQDFYLYSNFDNGVISGGRIDYVRIMTVVAILILIVACVNFMNLATARSGRRSKEIGLRKVMGAQRKSISLQFYFEATILAAISMVLSVLIVLMLLPYYNILVNKQLAIDFSQPFTWYFLAGVTLFVGITSGSYPALLLSTFNIIESLKGPIKQSHAAAFFRKGLVVFQFAISTLLIIGTTVIYKQIDYVLSKDLGLEKENLVMVTMNRDLRQRLETYKTELMKIPEVVAVSASSGNPVSYGRSTSSTSWEGKNPAEGYEVNIILSDHEFVETMGMEMLKGRAFSDQFADSTNFIINEVAAELMGFDDPLNKEVSFWGIDGKVIGVVKNFHMSDMYEPIAPLIITCVSPASAYMAMIRIQGNTSEALRSIEQVTRGLNPAFDFEYEFLDASYAEGYENEKTVGTLANIFSIISILISCLGLLGLSAFTAEQRSREIGVRKVHGASVTQILVMLSKDYSKLMLLAFVLAIPFGYYFTQQWLNNFEFRTGLDPFIFLIAGLVTFIIGVLTVSAKSYQAASVNPVESLKDE